MCAETPTLNINMEICARNTNLKYKYENMCANMVPSVSSILPAAHKNTATRLESERRTRATATTGCLSRFATKTCDSLYTPVSSTGGIDSRTMAAPRGHCPTARR
jgi:hypothetical protein